jgi:hypothetical protein
MPTLITSGYFFIGNRLGFLYGAGLAKWFGYISRVGATLRQNKGATESHAY